MNKNENSADAILFAILGLVPILLLYALPAGIRDALAFIVGGTVLLSVFIIPLVWILSEMLEDIFRERD